MPCFHSFFCVKGKAFFKILGNSMECCYPVSVLISHVWCLSSTLTPFWLVELELFSSWVGKMRGLYVSLWLGKLWLCMFLISPSHSISRSLSNLDSLGRYFILACYPSFYLNKRPIELTQGFPKPVLFFATPEDTLKCQSFHVPSFTSIWKKKARLEIHPPSHGMN